MPTKDYAILSTSMNLISSRLKMIVVAVVLSTMILAGWRLGLRLQASNHRHQVDAACQRAELQHLNNRGQNAQLAGDDKLCQEKQN